MNTENLTEKRQKLLDHLVKKLVPNPEILGLFLGGSLAVGNADAFSDIDLRVVLRDPVKKSKFLSKSIFLSIIKRNSSPVSGLKKSKF